MSSRKHAGEGTQLQDNEKEIVLSEVERSLEREVDPIVCTIQSRNNIVLRNGSSACSSEDGGKEVTLELTPRKDGSTAHFVAEASSDHRSRRQGLTLQEILSQISSTSCSLEYCRICHSSGRLEKLVSPCKCKGTMVNVHVKCLETWLQQKGSQRCELCGFEFSTRKSPLPWTQWFIPQSTDTIEHKRERKCFYYDLACLLVLLPLTIASTWLCINGGITYVKQSEETKRQDVSCHQISPPDPDTSDEVPRNALQAARNATSMLTSNLHHVVRTRDNPRAVHWTQFQNTGAFGNRGASSIHYAPPGSNIGHMTPEWEVERNIGRDNYNRVQKWRHNHAKLSLIISSRNPSQTNMASPSQGEGQSPPASSDGEGGHHVADKCQEHLRRTVGDNHADIVVVQFPDSHSGTSHDGGCQCEAELVDRFGSIHQLEQNRGRNEQEMRTTLSSSVKWTQQGKCEAHPLSTLSTDC
ncbi:unnamed protein product [Cyprideis torosa]|uniref:Uncharacterized protein n=1 Tax=Cyprideis torosa TaxID=163714 RepID=A0A7R8WFT8_9CRUS|nr:unnamed protein product [Cyprideis torosa]CAG0894520.1 unnamed protein product [Cyprideis torosa]